MFLFSGTNHFLPWLNLFFRLPMILGMAKADDDECRKKYGVGWDSYREKVKYKVFPYIY